jgi:hypothetical protein
VVAEHQRGIAGSAAATVEDDVNGTGINGEMNITFNVLRVYLEADWRAARQPCQADLR